MSLTGKLSLMKLGFTQAIELKNEWIDLKALENPRRSIVDYGTVGCTKDLMGRDKHLIIVDCITKNGSIPGALWTFLTESKTKKGKSYDSKFTETAVAETKAREIQTNQTQEEQMTQNARSTSSKLRSKKQKKRPSSYQKD